MNVNTATTCRVASQLMQRDILTVSPDETLRDALALMTENHVTGLPVMDDNSRCIGLITANDILNYEQENARNSDESGRADVYDAETEKWETISLSAFGLQEFGDVRVSDVMTCDLVWVTRDTELKEVAQKMINENVHRILVMDSAARLYGIISAVDIVRFVAEN